MGLNLKMEDALLLECMQGLSTCGNSIELKTEANCDMKKEYYANVMA